MIEVFKKEKSEKFLTAPTLAITDSREDKQIDKDLWLRELRDSLKSRLEGAIDPLRVYLEQFNGLVSILQMKPDEIIAKLEKEDEENPKDVLTLKEEIDEYYVKEK